MTALSLLILTIVVTFVVSWLGIALFASIFFKDRWLFLSVAVVILFVCVVYGMCFTWIIS